MEGGMNPLFHWPQTWKVLTKREGFGERIKVSAGLWISVITNLNLQWVTVWAKQIWSKERKRQRSQRVAEKGDKDRDR